MIQACGSGYLISNGYRQLDELIFSDKIQLIFSEELIEEFINVTKRPKFKKYFSSEDILKLLELFNTVGKLVTVTSDIDACRDEKDNFLLSLAADSHADFLITGDADLLELRKFS